MAEQQRPGAAEHGAGLAQRLHPRELKKTRADQKVAVATDKKHGLRCGAFGQGLGAALLKNAQGVVQHIVADPGFKQVAQDEQGIGRGVAQIGEPGLRRGWVCAVQVHVR